MSDNYLFKFLDNISFVKNKNFINEIPEDSKKILSPFICNLWLSHNDALFPLSDILNDIIFNLSLEQYYHLCRIIIPKNKYYFKWIKKNKDKNEKYPDWLVDIFIREFEFVSKKEVIEYLQIENFGNLDNSFILKNALTEQQKKYLKEKYKLNVERKLVSIIQDSSFNEIVSQKIIINESEDLFL